ncbi:hypothetical protein ABZP36_005728 [Zizania latifolia]
MSLEASQLSSSATPTLLLQDTVSQQEQGQLNHVPLSEASVDFHARLEEFLAQVTTALPQALLPTPPKVQRSNACKLTLVAGRRSAHLAAKNLDGKGPSSLAMQVLAKKLGLPNSFDESNS